MTEQKMTQAGFTVDTSYWPAIQVIYPPAPSRQDVDIVVACVRRLFERGRDENVHVATIADLRLVHLEKSTSELRQHLAVSLAKIDQDFPGLAVCDAAVVSSPLLRLVISAHARFRLKRSHITRCFFTMEEAHAWADLTLRRHNRTARRSPGSLSSA